MPRKKPFSGKKKKEYLQLRRARKTGPSQPKDPSSSHHEEHQESHSDSTGSEGSNSDEESPNTSPKIEIPVAKERFPRNRLTTVFEKETKEQVQERKKLGYLPLNMYFRNHPWWESIESETVIDIPHRPPWEYSMSPHELERRERAEFEKWMKEVLTTYGPRLNYFETNMEVWRQLWRVLERSDVILLVVDARFPLFHFPPALYNHVVHDLKKPIILVLNKADIVDKKVADAWVDYLMERFPSLNIVKFSSFRPMAEGDLDIEKKRKFERGRRKYENAAGRRKLLETIRSLNITKNGKVIEIPELQIEKNNEIESSDEESDDSEQEEENEEEKEHDPSTVITIGTVGHPNVGKSSLINGLIGKKVVSTSRTPGHTKHFQTIFLTPEVVLCDCPGLVFPALDRPKDLQVLCGVFPVAQVREVFSSIRYLAERVPIEKVYGLKPPEEGEPWSPYSICEAFAIKRGYLVARTGAADVHRAGGEILLDCLDGKIVISWPPPSKPVKSDGKEKGKDEEMEDGKKENEEEDITVEDIEKSDGEEDEEEEVVAPKKKFKKNKTSLQKLQEEEEQEKKEKSKKIRKPSSKGKATVQEDSSDDDKPGYYAKLANRHKRGGNKFKGDDL